MNTETPLIVIEQTPSGYVDSWMALSEREFINTIRQANDGAHYVEYFDDEIDSIKELYDESQASELAGIISKHGRAICVTTVYGAEEEFHTPKTAPTEFEFYKSVLDSDMRFSAVMTELEAREFIASTKNPDDQITAVQKTLNTYF
jgi:hypothetical protein